VNGIARVVFDTNILFSSVGWLGNPYHCVQAARNGEGANFFCNLGCLLGVKAALELKLLGKLSKDGIAGEGQALTKVIAITGGLKVVPADPDDDPIVECAALGHAQFIVSGDRHLLALRNHQDIQIVKATDFLKLIRAAPMG